MGDGMNCGYICSLIGILKILTVLLTAIPAALLFIGTGAKYYTEEKAEDVCKEVAENANKAASTFGAENRAAPCPEKALGYTALSLFAICFIVSLVCLIVLLLVKLNENGIFKQLDFIYHLGGGVVVIIAGILAIAFGALALNKAPCKEDLVKETCEKQRKEDLEPEFHLAAGVIGLIGGIIYIFAALKLKKS